MGQLREQAASREAELKQLIDENSTSLKAKEREVLDLHVTLTEAKERVLKKKGIANGNMNYSSKTRKFGVNKGNCKT